MQGGCATGLVYRPPFLSILHVGIIHDDTFGFTVLRESYVPNVCVDGTINHRLLPSTRAILGISTVTFPTSIDGENVNKPQTPTAKPEVSSARMNSVGVGQRYHQQRRTSFRHGGGSTTHFGVSLTQLEYLSVSSGAALTDHGERRFSHDTRLALNIR